ncbi:uncharacterized protein ARMOST_21376 [Armillaria ostoyae]|uniref:Uncharacterized protein n=1 Tax=Armillaria ostoyae TaxID=47428 RepID=A0A284S9X8_ARMOS|nr:uncharacterized protein ARMOST_21376 [Armillaria ostoyae]
MPPCTCLLFPDGHELESKQKLAAHRLELKILKKNGRDGSTNREQVSNAASGSSRTASGEVVHMVPLGMSSDVPKEHGLADRLVALTLTDEGPNARDQSSKLWSSRREFQSSHEGDVPGKFKKVSIDDAQNSISAVANEALNPLPTCTNSSPTDPTSKPMAHPLRSPRTWQRQAIPRSAVLAAHRPAPAPLARVENIIECIEDEAKLLLDRLRSWHDVDTQDTSQVSDRREQLKAVDLNIKNLRESLSRVKYGHENVLHGWKADVVNLLRQIDNILQIYNAHLPEVETPVKPLEYDAGYVFVHPLEKVHGLAQLVMLFGVICHVIGGFVEGFYNLAIQTMLLLVSGAMATNLTDKDSDGDSVLDTNQDAILNQMPSSLYTALKAMNIDGHTMMYAVCPDCNSCYEPTYTTTLSSCPSYPTHCQNMIPGSSGRSPCHADLLKSDGKPRKPFLMASLEDYIARTLADSQLENLCDAACDQALHSLQQPSDPNRNITNVFQAEFMRHFKGPDGQRLFIDRGDKVRLAFALQVDFFNPNGTRKRGNHDSIGLISMANLNLPEEIRYHPEHIFLAGIIPGPDEPDVDTISNFIRPLIDICKIAWERGIRVSRTASRPDGRDVELAVILSVNDLPAARKMSGTASHASHWYCTVCEGYGISTMYDTCFHKWCHRDAHEMRRCAEAWRDALTSTEREKLFKDHGVRWSELWRLPYWDPTRMLVIDSMHCVLEGLVHYHCLHVLEIDINKAGKARKMVPAFDYPWIKYSVATATDLQCPMKHDKEIPHIGHIHRMLELPLGDGLPLEDGDTVDITVEQLGAKLKRKNASPLKFVCRTLNLPRTYRKKVKGSWKQVEVSAKDDLIDLLVEWCLKQPMTSGEIHNVRSVDKATIEHIQAVIKDTATPSWINSVPANYGAASAGTIKADEWRTLSIIYLPIALVTLWGDDDGHSPAEGSRSLEVLDHTMALFQAVTIVCRYTMNLGQATTYRTLLKHWVDGLYSVHPHTKNHHKRPNVHAAFHLYDFILAFGPVMSWWCFPFERLIGTLQKTHTNNHVGGDLEKTILQSFLRGANLRHHLNRPNCPQLIRQFKILFDKALPPKNQRETTFTADPPSVRQLSHAYYTYRGVTFSRQSTHLGGSLVAYYPTTKSQDLMVGSIQEIKTESGQVLFAIKRQAPLPVAKFDPFKCYVDFPATTYSSKMVDGPLDSIHPSQIRLHVAQYEFSHECAIIIDLCRD